MLKRLLIVAFCILSLPVLASISHNQNPALSSSGLVAYAGHSRPGNAFCSPCSNCSFCVCNPDEEGVPCTNRATPPSDDKLSGRGTPSSGVDYGAAAMILALALFVWLRVRT